MKSAFLLISTLALIAAPSEAQQIKASQKNPKHELPVVASSITDSSVLWDQSATPLVNGYVDQAFTDFPTYDTFEVNDVTVPAGHAWDVKKVTTYYTTFAGAWSPAAITSAKLQVFPKAGTLPVNATDIAPEYTVAATLTKVGSSWELSADTSGIAELHCISGSFWIGLTPITVFGSVGQEFRWVASATVGDNTAVRNPGGAFGIGTLWASLSAFDPTSTIGPPYEGTIKLEGDDEVPTWAPFPGTGKPGLFGPVIDTETGISCAGQPVNLTVSGLTEDFPVPSTGTLVVGLGTLMAPFKGGIFVPTVDLLLFVPLDFMGDGGVAGSWPTGIPDGTTINMQWWTKGLFGFAASDGFSVVAE